MDHKFSFLISTNLEPCMKTIIRLDLCWQILKHVMIEMCVSNIIKLLFINSCHIHQYLHVHKHKFHKCLILRIQSLFSIYLYINCVEILLNSIWTREVTMCQNEIFLISPQWYVQLAFLISVIRDFSWCEYYKKTHCLSIRGNCSDLCMKWLIIMFRFRETISFMIRKVYV